ncbi:hypothetical protein ACS0TY_020041 [Phlomoides rotata]
MANDGGKIPSLNPILHRHHGGGHHHYHGHGGARHHHHIFYASPHCPLHRSILQPNNHSPSCSFSTTYPYPQNQEPVASIPTDPQLSSLHNHPNQTFDDSQMIEEEIEKLEDEEEEDPVFVLTDEWREFFAKSEAKRRLGLPLFPCF